MFFGDTPKPYIRVIRVNVFLTTPRNHIIPAILNSFDNFVYISPSLYGGNVHFFAAYPKKLRVRGGENTGNHPSEPPKHRTSLHKTSDVCGRNLGTFHRRSPMFSGFRTPFLAEIPRFCPEIPILHPLVFLLPFPLSRVPTPFSAAQNLKFFDKTLPIRLPYQLNQFQSVFTFTHSLFAIIMNPDYADRN